jgi:hypothetical protein
VESRPTGPSVPGKARHLAPRRGQTRAAQPGPALPSAQRLLHRLTEHLEGIRPGQESGEAGLGTFPGHLGLVEGAGLSPEPLQRLQLVPGPDPGVVRGRQPSIQKK